MAVISTIRGAIKGITRTFGGSVVKSPVTAKEASVFTGTLGNLSPTAKNSVPTASFLGEYWSNLKIGLKKAEVQKLEGLDTLKFFEEAKNVLSGKIGIPQELLPSMAIHPQLPNPRMFACFSPPVFSVLISGEKIANFKKNMLFSILAHELQHCKQFLFILRSPQKAQKAIKHYSFEYAKLISDEAINNYKNLPMEIWEKLAKENSYQFDIVQLAKNIKKATPDELLKIKKQLISEVVNERTDALEGLRKITVEKMGILPENMEYQAQLYFDDLIKSSESGAKGAKYIFNVAEGEAYARQMGAYYSYLYHKFF